MCSRESGLASKLLLSNTFQLYLYNDQLPKTSVNHYNQNFTKFIQQVEAVIFLQKANG